MATLVTTEKNIVFIYRLKPSKLLEFLSSSGILATSSRLSGQREKNTT